MSLSGFKKGFRPRLVIASLRRLRSLGEYVRSGEDAEDSAIRIARIRADLESLLLAAQPDIAPGSLDPFLDYLAAKLASEGTTEDTDGAS